MNKLIKQIKENRVVNILLNPNGTLTRKEYWFAMILLFLLNVVPISSYQTIYTLLNTIFDYSNMFYLVNSTLYPLSNLPLLPYTFIIFYSSFIITFKRTKGHFNNPIRWLLGICTYLVPISVLLLRNIGELNSFDNSNAPIYSQLTILICVLVGLGIISIIVLSCLPNPDEEKEYDNKYGSLNFVFKFMGVNLIYAILMGVMYIWFSSKTIFGVTSFSSQLPLFVISLAYIVVIVFLIVKRSQDAKLPVYIPLVTILAVPIIISGLLIYFNLIHVEQETLLISLIPIFISLMISIINALLFVFIALPTKAPRDEVYW